jgi:hypothetical protein
VNRRRVYLLALMFLAALAYSVEMYGQVEATGAKSFDIR